MKKTVTLLFLAAALVYGLQLIIFHDPSTTGFYILQDVAFLPISIAVATIVVGEYLTEREKKERRQKTQMLTSTFFTELGSPLMMQLLKTAEGSNGVRKLFEASNVTDSQELNAIQQQLKQLDLHVQLTAENYPELRQQIESHREVLLVISSNPLLLDHEDFTEMLWGIFHLLDEFRLRGDFNAMTSGDITHLEADFTHVFRLLLINWTANALYTKNTYPNFYNAAISKLRIR